MQHFQQRSLSRRELLKQAGAAALLIPAAGAASVLSGCTSADHPAYRPWYQKHKGALTDLEYIVQCGTLAPSAHNSQPWKFRLLGDHILIFADRARHLGTADAQRRMMLMSIGCALENMSVAAARLGYQADVTLEADRQFADSGLCATLQLQQRGRVLEHPHFDALFARQTTRSAFAPLATAPQGLMQALHGAADLPGVALSWFTTSAACRALATLSISSVRGFLASDQRHRDGMRWFRISRSDWESRCDGIAVFNTDAPFLIKQYVEWLASEADVMGEDFKHSEIEAMERLAPLTPVWGLVHASEAAPDRCVQAGRIAERIYLEATARGYALQPVCYPTEVDAGRTKLRTLAGLPLRADPLFLFRLGRSDHVAKSVRRALAQVLV